MLEAAQTRNRMATRRLEILEAGETRPEHWLAALEELWSASKELAKEKALADISRVPLRGCRAGLA